MDAFQVIGAIELGVIGFCYFAAASLVVFGLYLAVTAPAAAAKSLGLALACLPFAIYVGRNQLAEDAAQARSEQIAALPRVKLPQPHPRTLVVLGLLPDDRIAELLETYGFDEIYLRRDSLGGYPGASPKADRWLLATRADAPGCPQLARDGVHWLRQARELVKTCLREADVNKPFDEVASDALVLAVSGQTTKSSHPGNLYRGDEVELRLRRNGRDDLIAFVDSANSTRQTAPFCLPFLGISCDDETGNQPKTAFEFLTGQIAP